MPKVSILELGFKSTLSNFGMQSLNTILDLSWKAVEKKNLLVYTPNCYTSFMRVALPDVTELVFSKNRSQQGNIENASIFICNVTLCFTTELRFKSECIARK